MLEVLLECSRCKKITRVERMQRSVTKPVCGHGTIITPSNAPNLLQCGCGAYLDDRHIVTPEEALRA